MPTFLDCLVHLLHTHHQGHVSTLISPVLSPLLRGFCAAVLWVCSLALVVCTIRWLLESEYRRATTPPSPSPRNLCPFWSPIRDLGKWLICLNSPEEFLSLRCKDTVMTLRYLSTLSHFMMWDPQGPWRSHHALRGAAWLQVGGAAAVRGAGAAAAAGVPPESPCPTFTPSSPCHPLPRAEAVPP